MPIIPEKRRLRQGLNDDRFVQNLEAVTEKSQPPVVIAA